MRETLNTNEPTGIVNNWVERFRLGIYLENYNGNSTYSMKVSPIDPFTIVLLERQLAEIFVDGVDVQMTTLSENSVSIRARWD